MVVLGSYIVDAGEDIPYDPGFVFKPGRKNYGSYLKEHMAAARASGALVAVSVCTVGLEDTIDFLSAAEEAGADAVSYCAHSTMEMFLRENSSSALCRREHWGELQRWTKNLLTAFRVPVIFKIGLKDTADTFGAVEVMAEAGAFFVHINVGSTGPGSAGIKAVGQLKEKVPFLIAGGGIEDVEGAKRVLSAGADAVAVGTAAMKDAGFCGRVQAELARKL